MSTVLLIRHGLTAQTGPILTGRTRGVHLDERGRAQAHTLAERLAAVPLAAVVTSPLERCTDTARAVLAAQRAAGRSVPRHVDKRVIECGYGDWTGRQISELVKEPLWRVVQAQPSAARFPGGESLAEMAARAVTAIRDWDVRLGEDAVWVACSHGDVIKAVLADALGMHLDQFQRLVVDPCSVTAIRYTDTRPFVLRANDSATELAQLVTPVRRGRRRARSRHSTDATVGGGAGAGAL